MTSPTVTDMPVRAGVPQRAVRVLLTEYWEQVLSDWQNYLQGVDPEPPRLAPPGRDRVFFTDPESIFVCRETVDFGMRLGLGYSTEEGCVALFFDLEDLLQRYPFVALAQRGTGSIVAERASG